MKSKNSNTIRRMKHQILVYNRRKRKVVHYTIKDEGYTYHFHNAGGWALATYFGKPGKWRIRNRRLWRLHGTKRPWTVITKPIQLYYDASISEEDIIRSLKYKPVLQFWMLPGISMDPIPPMPLMFYIDKTEAK
jgi:hypothetical protein